VSSFVIGSLYYPNWNNIAWSQATIGGAVLPGPNDGSFGYPQNQILMQESGQGLWTAGCAHWFDDFQIFRDYDTVAQSSAAIQCCPVCSFIIRVYEPYEEIFDTVRFPILV
jgi:hypothetical protein